MLVALADSGCTACVLHSTCKTVCVQTDGPRDAEALVIGEAPGYNEDQQGIPFVGKSGQLIRSELGDMPYRICNAVRCRPPENRPPKPKEIDACRQYVAADIASARYVLLLGATALKSVLGMKGIKALRGKPIEHDDGRIYIPTWHPSAVLRDPALEHSFKADIQLFKDICKRGKVHSFDVPYRFVNDRNTLEDFLDDLSGWVSWDVETTGLYPWHGKIVSMGFSTRRNNWVIPWDHEESRWRHKLDSVLADIDATIQTAGVKLIAHNGKFDSLFLYVRHGIHWAITFDTMLAHYVLDENQLHGLDKLASDYFGAPDYDIPLDVKQGKHGIAGKHARYLALDTYYTRKAAFKLMPMLDELPNVKRVFERIIMPCQKLFTEVEYDGVYIDQSKFGEAESYLRDLKAEAESELNDTLENSLTGDQLQKWKDNVYKIKLPGDDGKKHTHKVQGINWGSPNQLRELLFNDLGIEPLDKTPKGDDSTSESVLKRIDHPLVGSLLKLRGANQRLSFFIEGWKPYLVDGYLHPSFKIHGTVTGRLSAEHPNLQQVPRDERIRQLISAPDDGELIEADLSQIELRIAAELSEDPALMYAFTHDIDVHWLTALREIERGAGYQEEIIATGCNVSGKNDMSYAEAIEAMLEAGPDRCVESNKMWKEVRKKAKAINFGYLFGMWWKKFKIYARDNYGVNVDDEQAKASREAFFELYQALEPWHRKQKKHARTYGYVASLSGRRRNLPEARSKMKSMARDEAERQGINAPVQSFANELNLMSALQLRQEFGRDVIRICGTVHDSILVRVLRKADVPRVANRILEIMRQPALLDDFKIKLKVPIEADLKIGPWGKGVSLDKWRKANGLYS